MPLSSYMYTFSPRPERGADFVEWARARGVPFWLSRPGLRAYRTYRVHAGSGTSLTDLQSWVLGPGATGDEPLGPSPAAASSGERA